MKRPEIAPILAKILLIIIRVLLKIVRPRARVGAISYIMDNIHPYWTTETKHGPVTFYCPAPWPYSRSDMLKEPKTYAWIDQFEPEDTFWDIGANVGVYSLYAAAAGHRVVAFEPVAINNFVLVKNIELNRMDDRITSLAVAINDTTGIGCMMMPHTRIGGAQHTFQSNSARNESAQHIFKHYTMGSSMDDMTTQEGIVFPNHIKIDVDGNEDRIIAGGSRTLSDSRLKSVLVEVRTKSTPSRLFVEERMESLGFTLVEDPGEKMGNLVYKKTWLVKNEHRDQKV